MMLSAGPERSRIGDGVVEYIACDSSVRRLVTSSVLNWQRGRRRTCRSSSGERPSSNLENIIETLLERLTDKKLSIPRSLQNRLLRECPKIMSEATSHPHRATTDAPYTGFNGQDFDKGVVR